MQTITTIGLDIAKSVFRVHGVDAHGQVVGGPAFFAYSDNYLIDVKFGVSWMSRRRAPSARPRSANSER